MSKIKSLLAMMMVILLCTGIFAGCAPTTANNNSSSDNDSNVTQSSQSNTSDADLLIEEVEDVIGEVTYIGTSYLSVTAYKSESEITDYAALDIDTLTEAGSTEYVYLDDTVAYYKVSEGALVSIAAEDVTAGCLIAITTDDDGTQQIIILKTAGEETEVDEDETNEGDEDETTGTGEDADVVAEVTAVNDDGTLELTIYDVVDDTVEITDYAAVDLDNYTVSETTGTYTIVEDAIIAVAGEGVLTETTSAEIVAGDVIVIYTDEDGAANIAVYHAEEDAAT